MSVPPAPTPQTPALEVIDLVKKYAGVSAVNKISFSAARGEIVGFLGPNGAGKSTTMRILTGYLPATGGSVRICGVSVASHPEEAKKLLGYMPENNPLPEEMRVAEYLRLRGRLKEMPRARLRDRIETVLEQCDLKHVRQRIIGKLSKGYRQRVGIAEAILAEPPLILMDEPTIGLDPHQIEMIRDLISGLRGRMTVLISSHILPEIERTCDRVIILNGGHIVGSGSPEALRREMFGHAMYRLEIAGNLAALPTSLAALEPTLRLEQPPEPRADGFADVRVLTGTEEELGERLLRELPLRGYRVRALTKVNPSLEDVFLAATRRSQRGDAAFRAALPAPAAPAAAP